MVDKNGTKNHLTRRVTYVIQSYGYSVFKKRNSRLQCNYNMGYVLSRRRRQTKFNFARFCQRYDLNFQNLRRVALEQYKYWNPDMVIIEQKASGTPLTHELRQMDIPVMTFTPSRGNDKHVRVNSCAPLFEAGLIWAPDEKVCRRSH